MITCFQLTDDDEDLAKHEDEPDNDRLREMTGRLLGLLVPEPDKWNEWSWVDKTVDDILDSICFPERAFQSFNIVLDDVEIIATQFEGMYVHC